MTGRSGSCYFGVAALGLRALLRSPDTEKQMRSLLWFRSTVLLTAFLALPAGVFLHLRHGPVAAATLLYGALLLLFNIFLLAWPVARLTHLSPRAGIALVALLPLKLLINLGLIYLALVILRLDAVLFAIGVALTTVALLLGASHTKRAEAKERPL